MFLFHVLNFFKKGTLIKGGHYLRKYGNSIRTPWSSAIGLATAAFLPGILNKIIKEY